MAHTSPHRAGTPRVEEGLTALTQRQVAPFITGESLRESETFLPPEFQTAFADLRTALSSPSREAAPLIQTLIQALQPSEADARQRQADLFRKSGAISDASRAVAGGRLESDIIRNRQTTGAEALLKFIGPLLQGRQSALASIPTLSRDTTRSRDFGFGPQAARGGGGIRRGGGISRQLRAPTPSGINFAPQFNLGPGGEAQQAPAGLPAAAPSSGAVAFGPGDFDLGGQTSFSNQDLQGFQDFSQQDQDFLFGR